MNIYTDKYIFETKKQFQVINLTGWMRSVVSTSKVKDGLAIIYTGHTTGGIVLNELESRLVEDLKTLLAKIVPPNIEYSHPQNAQSHLISTLLSSSQVIPIEKGALNLGTWQSLFWVEGEKRPRRRMVNALIMGE